MTATLTFVDHLRERAINGDRSDQRELAAWLLRRPILRDFASADRFRFFLEDTCASPRLRAAWGVIWHGWQRALRRKKHRAN